MKRTFFTFLLLMAVFTIMADEMVYTPILKSPADNATFQMPDVPLSWYAVTGGSGLQYELTFDTSAAFNSPIRFDTIQTLLTGYYTRNLFFGKVYYWKVRAIDNGNTSAWSPARSFTVFSFVEIDDVHGVKIADTNQSPDVMLRWDSTLNFLYPLTGIDNFDLQIDTSANYNSPVLVSRTFTGGIYKFKNRNLLFNTTYYWRVRPRHAGGAAPWDTALWYFKVVKNPALKLPANNAINQSLDAKLKWDDITGIRTYQYQIATDQNFTNIADISETDTSVANAEFLTFGNSYYWRVRARHLTDTSDWSPPFRFTVTSTVILKSPANNAQNVAVRPTLAWKGQTGLTGYQLELDSLNSFVNPIVSYKPKSTDSSYQVTKNLKYLKTYYWRMRAFAVSEVSSDTSAWSTAWSFKIQGPVGIAEPGIPAFAIYPNPASGIIYIRMDSKEANTVQFSLFDLVGRKVFQKELNFTPGQNVAEIILDNIGKGVYIGRLSIGDNIVNRKIIIDK
jgi:hypothetical protein